MTLIWWLLERCVYTVDSQPYTHMIQKKTKTKKTQRNIAAYQKQRMKAKQQQKSTPKDYTHRVYFFYMLHRILVWIRDVRAYNARGSVKPSTAHCTILYTIYLYCVVAPSALRGVRTMLKREKEIACVLLLLLGQFQCGSNPTKKKNYTPNDGQLYIGWKSLPGAPMTATVSALNASISAHSYIMAHDVQ